MENILFSPLKIGDVTIKNRIIMAPLTRQRAGAERIPNDLMKEYYVKRASAGLILSEATSIDPIGVGYKDSPGIWNESQVEGWKKITKAVHQAGGVIFLQLWHVGRVSDPSFLNGQRPVAPSEIKPKGFVSQLRPQREYVVPRALETHEVQQTVQLYKRAAENAKRAQFDGVEIHAANGYLIDQFLQSSTNQRTDRYGGSLQNRMRFLLEIVDEVISVWGAGRVGVHLAPACDSHDMGDDNPSELFLSVAQELGRKNIGFIFAREAIREGYLTSEMKKRFGGVMIANQGFDPQQAARIIQEGGADAVSWGKYFISNPDLVERIKNNLPFRNFDPETFYSGGATGYTDLPL